MFDDDFWGFVGVAALGTAAYFLGKGNGVTQTITQYESAAVIKSQQDQIDQLNAKLNQLTQQGK